MSTFEQKQPNVHHLNIDVSTIYIDRSLLGSKRNNMLRNTHTQSCSQPRQKY